MKKKRIIGMILSLSLFLLLVSGVIWLVAAGYAERAIRTVVRWGEDGTMDLFEVWVVDELLPMGARIFGGAGAVLAVLCPLIRKLKTAKKMMDDGTAQAVATYGERKEMQAEMRAFMEEQRLVTEQMRQEMREEFSRLASDHHQSLASDRRTIRRIEGKVDGIRRIEAAAFGDTGELIRKGTATKIMSIIGETEGGEFNEDDGNDAEAAQNEETD